MNYTATLAAVAAFIDASSDLDDASVLSVHVSRVGVAATVHVSKAAYDALLLAGGLESPRTDAPFVYDSRTVNVTHRARTVSQGLIVEVIAVEVTEPVK